MYDLLYGTKPEPCCLEVHREGMRGNACGMGATLNSEWGLEQVTSTDPFQPKLLLDYPETGVKICLLIYVRRSSSLCCYLEYKRSGVIRITMLG